MLKIIFYILWGLALIHALYFLVTALPALRKPKRLNSGDGKTKFAVLIPARNEEKVIGELIDSLNKQRYSKVLYDIIVLVNNCTDNTRNISIEAGAKVLEIKKKVSSKGEVLICAMEELKDTDYDAYIIFDADNVVDEDFLIVMDDVYSNGYKVAQGQRESKNINDCWISTCYSLFYYIQNLFFNRARLRMNASCSINGTGFMVDKNFAEEKFRPKTLTEDIELSILCNLNNETIYYAEDAITFDEQPINFKVSWKQRTRWSVGIMQCVREYGGKLLKSTLKFGSFSCFDKLLFIITPYFQVLSSMLGFIAFTLGIFGIHIGIFANISKEIFLLYTILGYIVSMIFYALVLIYHKKSVIKNFLGIVLFNFFIFTWVFINIYSIPKKTIEWKPIAHGRSMRKEK